MSGLLRPICIINGCLLGFVYDGVLYCEHFHGVTHLSGKAFGKV
jgi:hypothetical protein